MYQNIDRCSSGSGQQHVLETSSAAASAPTVSDDPSCLSLSLYKLSLISEEITASHNLLALSSLSWDFANFVKIADLYLDAKRSCVFAAACPARLRDPISRRPRRAPQSEKPGQKTFGRRQKKAWRRHISASCSHVRPSTRAGTKNRRVVFSRNPLVVRSGWKIRGKKSIKTREESSWRGRRDQDLGAAAMQSQERRSRLR